MRSNKEIVLAFYEAGLNNKDFTAASELLGTTYTQHNPRIADGVDGFRDFVAGLAEDFPDLRADVKHLFADGDYVVAHVHGIRVPGQRGTAIVEFFRLDNGKIVEHWDVMQPVPETSLNPHGMF
ncbi:nuclear transport factor 2 family protein [Winogradskya consettensis]|uniref:Polyketide cyclase n=1 Tax=Winogradskya consettensis TaxID=113560 RepID=A0A919SC04_9ACTN|nr:ester cyclase [Actinoplanes consettensis]GIM68844.1 polyketide cyclase [Actinoplanes consettensis]